MSISSFYGPEPDHRPGYRIRVNVGKDATGKYVAKCRTTYGTLEQARSIERQMKDAARDAQNCHSDAEVYRRYREAVINLKSLPLKGAYDRALAKPHCRATSETRIKFKRNYWVDFAEWMKVKNPLIRNLQDVTPVHAENYIASIRKSGLFLRDGAKRVILSNDTLNEAHRTLQQVFELMKNETGMLENPFSSIPKLAPHHAERNAYTDEQLKIIFSKADGYLKPMFLIGLFTGLSEEDVCTLRKNEIHFDRHHIYRKRHKTLKSSGRISAIPMLPVLEDFLRGLCGDSGNDTEYVLPIQAADYARNRSSISKKIKNFLEIDCGFDTRIHPDGRTRNQSVLDFHSLRHTFCSMAGVVGIPMNVVQNIVGHMTPRMTELYSRHVEEQERLRWISLLGERINVLPGIPENLKMDSASESMEPERKLLMEKISKMEGADIQAVLALLG